MMANRTLLSLLLGISVAFAAVSPCLIEKYPTCRRDFKKVGCFYEDRKAVLLINDRDPRSPKHENITIDWQCYDQYLHALACRCSAKAKAGGFDHFSIRYYGLCYGMNNPAKALPLPPSGCATKAKGKIHDCTPKVRGECAGRYVADYIYEVGRDGGYGPWGPYDKCNTTCGVGVRTRTRQCNKPTPLGNGRKCIGPSIRTRKCNITNCLLKVDGGWGSFSNWSTCKPLPSYNASSCNPCPPGITERTRLCNNPVPANGGRPCVGVQIEGKPCNTECSIDGNFSSWSNYSICSKSCGGGMQFRTRECNNPPPFGPLGKACVGNRSEHIPCNTQACPPKVDGGFGEWSSFSTCTKSCGGGVQVRSRKCNKPVPSAGGKTCAGARRESRGCKNDLCPGSYGCDKIQELVQRYLKKYQKTRFPGKRLTGKFYKAIFDIQEAAAEECAAFNATSQEKLKERLAILQPTWEIAVSGGSINYGRVILGKCLFIFIKIRILSGTAIDEIEGEAIDFLDKAKTKLGVDFFSQLVSSQGDATLMFTIDTTGSMAEEIRAAKAIAKTIINQTRDFHVDYILSPFNDPATGPVTHKSEAERAGFVAAIDALRASGGGDCPEMAIKGMTSALEAGPRFASPMFVFTDASAKDDTPSNMAALKELADKNSASINFFLNPNGCPGKGIKTFKEIAEYTAGQIFPLKNESELVTFTSFVSKSLATDTFIASGGTRITSLRPRPGAPSFKHTFYIDDGIRDFAISVSVTIPGTASRVTLRQPDGSSVTATAAVALVAIFEVKNSAPGLWTIILPAAVGGYEYHVLGVSRRALEFTYNFLYKDNSTTNSLPVAINRPIMGVRNIMVIRLGGSKFMNISSLRCDLIDDKNQVLVGNLKLSRVGMRDIRKVSIIAPQRRFAVRLTGKTTSGYFFQRQSRGLTVPTKAFMNVPTAGNEIRATIGQKNVQVLIKIVNRGDAGKVTFTAHANLGQVTPATQSIMLNKSESIRLSYNAPTNAANKGKTETITVVGTATSPTKYTTFTATVDLLLV